MKQKIKAKSNYKARGSSVDLYCSVHVQRAKARSKSRCKVSARGKKRMKGGYEMDLGYVTVGMVLTLLVLFIAEGICTALREKGGGS